MALNSTPRRRFGVGFGVVLTGVAAGLIGFAGVASAHTRGIEASCEGDTTTLTVDLKAYADGSRSGKENHVTITDNGNVLVDTGFQTKYSESFKTSGAEKHTFLVDITAFDGAQYGGQEKREVEACLKETPPPPETTSEEVPPTTETTTEAPPETTSSPEAAPVVATSTTPPAPAAEGGPLAETGASIAIPLGIAGVLIVGGAGALFVVRRRSKA